jgi:thiamine biosynthesis lipoprotein
VALDLGGIGKGRAVDLVTDALAPSVDGGLVELGGDLRVWGEPPDADGWRVGVEDLRTGRVHSIVRLAEGAVATSSVLRRRWTIEGASRHHLIDPRTGQPTAGELVSVTVVAGRAEGCDVLAKAALVTGTVTGARRLLEAHGVSGWVVPRAGAPVPVGDVDDLVEAA